MKNHRTEFGFTLMEIMIAIAVMSTMVGLAIPLYSSTIEASRSNEAKANLYTIYMAEKVYRLNNDYCYPYSATPVTNIALINNNLNIEISSQYYTIELFSNTLSGSLAGFTATAKRNNAGAKIFTLTYAGSADTATPSIVETGSY